MYSTEQCHTHTHVGKSVPDSWKHFWISRPAGLSQALVKVMLQLDLTFFCSTHDVTHKSNNPCRPFRSSFYKPIQHLQNSTSIDDQHPLSSIQQQEKTVKPSQCPFGRTPNRGCCLGVPWHGQLGGPLAFQTSRPRAGHL